MTAGRVGSSGRGRRVGFGRGDSRDAAGSAGGSIAGSATERRWMRAVTGSSAAIRRGAVRSGAASMRVGGFQGLDLLGQFGNGRRAGLGRRLRQPGLELVA